MKQQRTQENTGLKYTQGNQGMENRREARLGVIGHNETRGVKLETLTKDTNLQNKTGNTQTEHNTHKLNTDWGTQNTGT